MGITFITLQHLPPKMNGGGIRLLLRIDLKSLRLTAVSSRSFSNGWYIGRYMVLLRCCLSWHGCLGVVERYEWQVEELRERGRGTGAGPGLELVRVAFPDRSIRKLNIIDCMSTSNENSSRRPMRGSRTVVASPNKIVRFKVLLACSMVMVVLFFHLHVASSVQSVIFWLE